MEGLLTNWIRVQGTGAIHNSSFFSQFLVMDLFFFWAGVLKAWLISFKNLGCFFGVGVGSLTTDHGAKFSTDSGHILATCSRRVVTPNGGGKGLVIIVICQDLSIKSRDWLYP